MNDSFTGVSPIDPGDEYAIGSYAREVNVWDRWLRRQAREQQLPPRPRGVGDFLMAPEETPLQRGGVTTDAKEKARERLQKSLTPAQWKTFTATGAFDVIARPSGNRYRIQGGTYIGNIYRLDRDGRIIRSYCCHLYQAWNPVNFPIEDHLLAQALMIRTSEAELLDIAHPYGDYAYNIPVIFH